MKILSAIGGGFAGATVLTLLHETLRRLNPEAPRMDLLGMQAIAKSLRSANVDVPDQDTLFKITMAGDIVSNSIYYSLAAIGDEKKAVLRGTLLGLAAGVGAVYLPKHLGLDEDHSSRTPQTQLLTVALYLAGGLVASVTSQLLESKQSK